MKISKIRASKSNNVVYLAGPKDSLKSIGLSKAEQTFFNERNDKSASLVHIQRLPQNIYIYQIKENDAPAWKTTEDVRIAGDLLSSKLNSIKAIDVDVVSLSEKSQAAAFIEGMVLGNYQYLRYFSDKKTNTLAKIGVLATELAKKDIDTISDTCQAVYWTRDLVNTPVQDMTAEILSDNFKKMGKEAGFSVKVMKKSAIEKEGMGGLLAVNRGALNPPTFTIMEYKGTKPKNKKPIVLVGKGVVYDTGGLSLKPTANSMDYMKSDMHGSATVAGTMYAIAKAKLPLHVIALVPATENRPGGNAYTPGDVITMHNKMTVEVLNTDAEGRMCLADALSYAKKYKPELVIDAATLTGAAARAFGENGLVAMGNAGDEIMNDLKESGYRVFERVCEMPFWDDYADQLKSEIADMKNIGGPEAGAITAGKFLEKFTDYPYIHLDIAGPSFLHKRKQYRGIGGSGVGVRMLFDYFSSK